MRHGLASLAVAVALLGCGGDPEAAVQVELGARLYATRCAVCHDQDPAIGTKLDPATLRSYRTAKALYDYTRFAMPYDAARSMTNTEYWAVTGYMLRSRGLIGSDFTLGPDTAAALSLVPE